MIEKQIDLSNWPNGVTLDVVFDAGSPVTPFMIFVTALDKKIMLYYRTVNKANVSINLPKHPDQVILMTERPIVSILTGPLRKTPLKYNFNTDIITPRPYPISQIRTEYLNFIPDPETGLPSDQPARFSPSIGLKQLATGVLNKFPQQVVDFIDEHENGHYYYGRPLPPVDMWRHFSPQVQKALHDAYEEDEYEADRYAMYQLMNKGYNFSNVFNAVNDFLGDNPISRTRIQKMKENIMNEHRNLNYDWSR